MLKNYLKVALRHLRRQRAYAFINVFGLALGLACCLLIGLYLWGELSYDRHHAHADDVYRVGLERIYPNNTVWWAPVAPAVGPGVQAAYPEVIEAARLAPQFEPVSVRYDDKRFEEAGIVYTDPSFFDVFTAPFLRGDVASALRDPDAVVLTEETARRYFGDADPMGEVLVFDDTLSVTVTGVVATPPETSHFDFDVLRPLTFERDPEVEDAWATAFFFYTYLRLQPGASPEALEAKFRELERVHVGGSFDSEAAYEEWLASGNAYRFFLQPLTDVHLHSDLKWEIGQNGDAAYVYLFGVVALFILLLAVINFTNLATARSTERMREVGVRKVLGSQRGQLVQQFLTESVLMSAAALVLALAMVALVAPFFEGIVGRSLSVESLGHPLAVLVLVGFTLGIGLLAGSYPAFVLSGFRPAHVLKGLGDGRGPSRLRNGLVVAQFAIAIVLIVGTVVVYQQVGFMMRERLDLGEDLVVIVEDARRLGSQSEAFRAEALRDPNVVSLTYGTAIGDFGASTYRWVETPDHPVNLAIADVDEHYVPTLELELVAGRNLSRQAATDTLRPALLNETAVRMLGLPDDPVGQTLIEFTEEAYTVVGVLEDFPFESLRSEIRPLIVTTASQEWIDTFGPPPAAVRIRSADVPATLAALERTWARFMPERPFAYSFLDDEYAALYAAERATGQLFLAFAVLAVLIACLGLFGLAAFTVQRRKKELGIRKVIGAPVASLVALVSREFVGLVLVGFALAAPVAYLLMNRWLEDFAYRTEVGLGTLAFAGAVALLIALATVAYHALRAATSDPVDALRTE